MTIDANLLVLFIKQFGLPAGFLLLGGYLMYLFIKGPGMVFAAKVGDSLGFLARSAAEFLVRLTASLEKTHVEHVELGARGDAGVAALKAHVTAESTATRDHVTGQVQGLRARVEAVEDSIETTVRSVSGHQLAAAAQRPAAPTLPEQGASER